jgi:hypothetical protein
MKPKKTAEYLADRAARQQWAQARYHQKRLDARRESAAAEPPVEPESNPAAE